MIYITGDTHIPVDIQKLSTKKFPQQRDLTKDDYVIICGDFGGVWDDSNEEHYWIKWLKSKPFTTLFIDGNHENFDRLNSLPLVPFGGNQVHKVAEGIYHLLRGQTYSIEGKTFFTLGGASSHDRDIRTEGKNWWAQELPSKQDFNTAEKTLSDLGNKVDYILTHAAPSSVQKQLTPDYPTDTLTDFLEQILHQVQYQKWFFGHYHQDVDLNENQHAVFDRIISL